MKCQDCVHYEVCKEQDAILGENKIDEIVGVEKLCEYFKPQSRFVELPCEVGQTFYGLQETDWYAYECYGFKWGKKRGTNEDVLFVLTIYEMEFIWGEEAFLTEAEAENALKEREKE